MSVMLKFSAKLCSDDADYGEFVDDDDAEALMGENPVEDDFLSFFIRNLERED